MFVGYAEDLVPLAARLGAAPASLAAPGSSSPSASSCESSDSDVGMDINDWYDAPDRAPRGRSRRRRARKCSGRCRSNAPVHERLRPMADAASQCSDLADPHDKEQVLMMMAECQSVLQRQAAQQQQQQQELLRDIMRRSFEEGYANGMQSLQSELDKVNAKVAGMSASVDKAFLQTGARPRQ